MMTIARNLKIIISVILCAGLYFGEKNNFSAEDVDRVNLFFMYTGESLGELEPCGCSSSKLGGLLLRSGWANHIKSQYKYLHMIDGGFNPIIVDRQAEIKSIYHQEMLRRIGYHYRFVPSREKISWPLDNVQPQCLGVARTNMRWYDFKTVEVGNYSWRILFMAMEGESPVKAEVEKIIQKFNPDVVFVLTRGTATTYDSLVNRDQYILIVFLTDAQEPFSPISPRQGLLLISAGNRGRYAGLLQLNFERHRLLDWNNHIIGLDTKFGVDPGIANLLEKYKQQVKDEKLLDQQFKKISPIGFVGSDSCEVCHAYEYGQWRQKKHAHAFETLVKEKYHYDPECVGCHVVGYEYEEGFRNIEETPHLKDVGCEACHGPGAQHMIDTKLKYGKTNGVQTCISCHQHDRSPHFEYNKYRELIKHW